MTQKDQLEAEIAKLVEKKQADKSGMSKIKELQDTIEELQKKLQSVSE